MKKGLMIITTKIEFDFDDYLTEKGVQERIFEHIKEYDFIPQETNKEGFIVKKINYEVE